MYILTRNIKALGVKVVLSGEGADEALGGYLFFHKAPSPAAFHACGALPTPVTRPTVTWHSRHREVGRHTRWWCRCLRV